jgi:hypothetical protein
MNLQMFLLLYKSKFTNQLHVRCVEGARFPIIGDNSFSIPMDNRESAVFT